MISSVLSWMTCMFHCIGGRTDGYVSINISLSITKHVFFIVLHICVHIYKQSYITWLHVNKDLVHVSRVHGMLIKCQGLEKLLLH